MTTMAISIFLLVAGVYPPPIPAGKFLYLPQRFKKWDIKFTDVTAARLRQHW